MIYEKEIAGKFVTLRAVKESDAKFIIELRNEPQNNRFIHQTSTDIDNQIKWIFNQNTKPGDYYFLVSNSKGPVGCISLYNINTEEKTAELGRWVSDGNAFENLESALILHDFGFDLLELKTIYTCTVKDNAKVVNFWKRFGGRFDGYIEDDSFIMHKNVVEINEFKNNIKPKLSKLLGNER